MMATVDVDMTAQTTITKLREENILMAALLKKASGESLNAAEKEALAEVHKGRALEARLREKFDLHGAIEKAFQPRESRSLPAQDIDVSKASGDSLEHAIVTAFSN